MREVSNGNGVCWDVRANIASPTPQQVMAVHLWSSAGCGALCAFRANSLPSGNTPSPSVGPADSLPLVHNAHTRPRAHRYAGTGLDQVVDDIALLVMGGEQQHVLCQQQRGGHCGKREGAVRARSEWGPGGGGSRVRALRLSIRGGPGSLWVPRTGNTNNGVLAGHARESHGHVRGS